MTKIGEIRMTSKYWDCDCDTHYIHPKADACCEVCGAVREECPDSRVEEVAVSGYPLE